MFCILTCWLFGLHELAFADGCALVIFGALPDHGLGLVACDGSRGGNQELTDRAQEPLTVAGPFEKVQSYHVSFLHSLTFMHSRGI